MRGASRRYREVAQLHIDCINQGFLPTLGAAFLTLMYECLDRHPNALLLTCEREGRVVGFVTSATSLRGVYLQMLRHPWRLLSSLAPSLIRPRRLLRILEIVRYGMLAPRADAGLPRTELLSLAVSPEWRGKGCAEELYQRLQASLRQRGETPFKIVVGAPLAPAHRFYQRMGAVAAAEIEVHQGEPSTIYVQRD